MRIVFTALLEKKNIFKTFCCKECGLCGLTGYDSVGCMRCAVHEERRVLQHFRGGEANVACGYFKCRPESQKYPIGCRECFSNRHNAALVGDDNIGKRASGINRNTVATRFCAHTHGSIVSEARHLHQIQRCSKKEFHPFRRMGGRNQKDRC